MRLLCFSKSVRHLALAYFIAFGALPACGGSTPSAESPADCEPPAVGSLVEPALLLLLDEPPLVAVFSNDGSSTSLPHATSTRSPARIVRSMIDTVALLAMWGQGGPDAR